MNTLYELDYQEWVLKVVRTPIERCTPARKIITLAMPEVLEWHFQHMNKKEGNNDTFTDFDKLVHIRINQETIMKFTGRISRNTIGTTLKVMHNEGILSYRYFREFLNGRPYVLAYVFPHDKLWNGDIASKDKKDFKQSKSRSFVPCRKCDAIDTQPTGGIERVCNSCLHIDVYYPFDREKVLEETGD